MGNSGKLEDSKTVQWSIVVKTLLFFDYNTHFVLILECFFLFFSKFILHTRTVIAQNLKPLIGNRGR